MNEALKTGGAVLVGAILGATGSTAIAPQKQVPTAEILDAKHDKEAVLKQYIFAQARLNEEPVLNTDTASSEEMVAAYVAIANEKGATTNPNLFEGLSDKAKQEGVSCKK